MKSTNRAIRSLFIKGRSNGIKIFSLAVGMSIGLVLISKVLFEFTYDDFYPDKERIYRIHTHYMSDNEFTNEGTGSRYTSGGIGPGFRNEIPGVETATRVIHLGNELIIRTEDRKKYSSTIYMADTCLFDVLSLPVLVGDPKDILGRPMYVMVSRKLAEKMGGVGNLTGKTFEVEIAPGNTFIIGGVFENIPENSHLRYDMLISLNSISRFMWDGTDNWVGNDRYNAYVKLYPGVTPDGLDDEIRAMQLRHQPMEQMINDGIALQFKLHPLLNLYSDDPAVRQMAFLLALIAGILIFTAILNYILLVLSSLVLRTKEMAVYKSYGATGKNIMNLLMAETAVHVIIALFLSFFIILMMQGKILELLGVTVFSMFTFKTILVLSGVCFIIFLLSGVIPALFYTRIPVASAFRSYRESRRNWKLASLFMQFTAATFLLILLTVIWRQYNLMINDNPGYAYENLLYCRTEGISPQERIRLINELKNLPYVENVSACFTLPVDRPGGNGVFLPEDDTRLFTIADIGEVDDQFFSAFEIPVLEGSTFTKSITAQNSCMVNQSFAERITELAGWNDGVVGKNIRFTQHGASTIVGVFSDFRVGTLLSQDTRPAAVFYTNAYKSNTILLIKLHNLKRDHMMSVSDLIAEIVPDKDMDVMSYQLTMIDKYSSARLFRDAIIIGGLITLIISLIGLIGYIKDEIGRRRSEIAIRKINGGSLWDILRLFIKNIVYIALPALLIGGMLAFYMANKWLADFNIKSDLPFVLFLSAGIAVLTIIITVVISSCYETAKENPVNNLRSE